MILKAKLRHCVLPVLLSWAASTGCADPDGGRQAVSGMVTLHGIALDRGTISFYPSDPKIGTQAGGAISNGKYAVSRPKGLLPGTYKIAISSPDGKTPDAAADAAPGPSGNFASKERIPADFNRKSDREITVVKNGDNIFDFVIP